MDTSISYSASVFIYLSVPNWMWHYLIWHEQDYNIQALSLNQTDSLD